MTSFLFKMKNKREPLNQGPFISLLPDFAIGHLYLWKDAAGSPLIKTVLPVFKKVKIFCSQREKQILKIFHCPTL